MLPTPRFLRHARLLLAVLSLTTMVLLPVAAQADDIAARGFKTEGELQPGWVVAMSDSASDTVKAAPADNLKKMFGVVIDPSKAPATVRKESNKQSYVVTSGTFPVLVNTQNGEIKPGDYLSMSLTDGIAGKATRQQGYVLGRAIDGFDGQNRVLVGGGNGTAIGRVQAEINITINPLQYTGVSIPEPLRRAGEAIAGKTISSERIYAALGVFTVCVLLAAVLLWGGVRSAIVSIGRNPLSRHSIFQGLSQVIGMSAMILVIGLITVYLLLKL